MQGVYGIIKTDDATVPVANSSVEYNRDTDLGITFNTQHDSSEPGKIPTPPAGTTGTVSTVTPGSGYTLGEGKTLVQTSSTGTGTGLRIATSIVESGGILKAGSTVSVTAGFQTFQNNLLKNYTNLPADPYTWTRNTASGAAVVGGTTTAITSTGGSGTGATFLVTVATGTVTNITISDVGSGYAVGDIVTLTVANLQTALNVINGNNATVTQGDIKLTLTADNIFGGIGNVSQVRILTPGKGHAVGDVITFKEEGTDNVGTGSVAVATLQTLGGTVISATAQNKTYPAAIRYSGATAAVINVLDLNGTLVSLGTVQPGQLIPYSFSQVEGTTPAVIGTVQVLYK